MLIAISSALKENLPGPPSSLHNLVEELILSTEKHLNELCVTVSTCTTEEKISTPRLNPSSGGRPSYNITKQQIEQLRETGMNWVCIAKCLGISDKTLQKKT